MPKLERSEWYDLSRDMNWQFKYVRDTEVFPEALSESKGIPPKTWWNWDEPYKISYRDYVKNQAEKESGCTPSAQPLLVPVSSRTWTQVGKRQ